MTNPEAIEVSVVFPCLNEAGTVGRCVEAALQAMASASIVGEVVVADNGSTDQSRAVAEAAGARVIEARFRGYGSALRAGLSQAHGKFLVFLDADLSYNPADIPRFVEELRQGAEVVIGSRMRGGIEPGAMPFLHRVLGTPVLTTLANVLFACPITDINCGMRGLSKAAFQRLDLHADGMEFATEMMIKAAKARLRIVEIPIVLHVDQRDHPPHLRSFRDGWRHVQLMMHFCSMWVFLLPGSGLSLLSFLGLFFLPIPGEGAAAGFFLGLLCAGIFGVLIVLLGVIAQGRVEGSKFSWIPDTLTLRLLKRLVRVEMGLFLGIAIAVAGGAALLFYAYKSGDPGAATAVFRGAFVSAGVLLSGLQIAFASAVIGLFGIRVEEGKLLSKGCAAPPGEGE